MFGVAAVKSVQHYISPAITKGALLIQVLGLYARVVRWRCLRSGTLLAYVVQVDYSDATFQALSLAAAVLMALHPLLWTAKNRLIHHYFRWRVQRAFYPRRVTQCCGRLQRHECQCSDFE